MSKRVYLPEIKRLITCTTGNLRICKAVPGHNRDIPPALIHLPFPENCRRYEVRYRQSKKGKYQASYANNISGMTIRENGRYLQLCCFIPKSWHGKKFNRYVKVVY